MTLKQRLIGTAILLLLPFVLGAQGKKTVVSGYVRDAETGEPLPQAVVYLEDRKTGVAADAVGYYSLSVPAGKHTVYCAYFGYVTEEHPMDLRQSVKLDFHLAQDRNELDAATVFSRSKREEIKLPQMGLERVDAGLVQKMPTLMGEADIIRVIQMMPGVQTPSEGSTGFSVRGGGIDQNLILVDGAPVYNCGHFLGFLSMFNGDAIRGADLYKGDFPALYGGRLSSVLDISTKDGNNRSFGGNASIGLITSKLFLEGPIVPEKLSFMLAGRRTYMDLLLPFIGAKLPDKTQMYFYDLNGKLSWIAGEKDRVYLSAFSGKDVFGFSMQEFNLSEMVFGFANHTQSLRWNHVYGPSLTSDLILYNSLYRNDIGTEMDHADFDTRQQIRETGVKAGWTWYLSGSNTLKAGLQAAYFGVVPGEHDAPERGVHHPGGETPGELRLPAVGLSPERAEDRAGDPPLRIPVLHLHHAGADGTEIFRPRDTRTDQDGRHRQRARPSGLSPDWSRAYPPLSPSRKTFPSRRPTSVPSSTSSSPGSASPAAPWTPGSPPLPM